MPHRVIAARQGRLDDQDAQERAQEPHRSHNGHSGKGQGRQILNAPGQGISVRRMVGARYCFLAPDPYLEAWCLERWELTDQGREKQADFLKRFRRVFGPNRRKHRVRKVRWTMGVSL